jgi:tetratricopeptide (TPR) repeat protein
MEYDLKQLTDILIKLLAATCVSMKESKRIMYKFADIAMKTTIVSFVFLMLYFYLPIANRILKFSLNSYSINSHSNNYSFFGPPKATTLVGGLNDTLVVLGDLLVIFFVFFLPSGLIILLAWKMVKKVDFHPRSKYKSTTDQRKISIEGLMAEKIYSSTSKNISLSVKEWLEKGKALYLSGSHQDAINAFTNALNLSPGYTAYFNRGVVYNKLGNKKQAVNNIKAAARLGHKKSQKMLESKGIAW